MKLALSALFSLGICALSSLFATGEITLAQVTSDGTVNTQVNQNDNVSEITGGETRGSNLFHSFREFSVQTGNEAFFNNAATISNIFSRVTGGNVSNIDGLLRANGGANLFLINPAGIIFGENARLDIGGSFYGSSASSILFEDGEFSATDLENPPLLTINAPIGLNFRDNPGDILNRSKIDNNGLQVDPGNNIFLIGGDINFDGGIITAPGGNVELGGLSAVGEIKINSNGTLSFPDDIARSDVSLQNRSGVLVSSGGGGNITVNARNFELQGSLFSAGIGSGLGSPDAVAGDITINATDNVSLDGQDSNFVTFINNSVSDNGIGNAGKINISARNISLTNGSQINSFISGQGNSSNITLDARENVSINGSNDSFNSVVGSFVNVSGVGNSGSTNITAENLTLTNGGQIQSLVAGVGDSGDINVDVRDSVSADGEAIFAIGTIPSQINSNITFGGSGNSGDINITTSQLSLTNGGQISVDTFGMGNAGNIDITATESIALNGRSSQGGSFSGISSEVITGAEGNGGNIQISTRDFSVSSQASVATNTLGIGNGGKIDITATNLSITNGGDIAATTFGLDADNIARGDGGDITINVSDTFSVNGTSSTVDPQGEVTEVAAGIFASNQGNSIGNAGNIDITASKLSLANGSQINSFTRGRGNAGNITINVDDSVSLDAGNESEVGTLISTDIDTNGVGNGGEIKINTNSLSILNGAAIQNITSGEGNAGSTNINARDSIVFNGQDREGFASGVFSSVGETARGNGGTINIITDNLNILEGAAISARSLGEGNGGNIFIQANSLNLNEGSAIRADTSFGTGGNIQLQISDTIFLGENSRICAEATNNANGGNLTIDTNFIVAFPNQNSDIIANAQQGNGGNINITAESVFGIEERPLNNVTNDINASSSLGAQFNGNVTIVTPDINAIQTEIQLPTNLIESEQTAEQACQRDRVNATKNSLIVKGKGGIPPEPIAPLDVENIIINGQSVTDASLDEIEPIHTNNGDIIPARGVIRTEDGRIILTAYATNNLTRVLDRFRLQ